MKKQKIVFVFLSLLLLSSRSIFGELNSLFFKLILTALLFTLLFMLFDLQKFKNIIKQISFLFFLADLIFLFALPVQFELTRLLTLVLLAFFAGKIFEPIDSEVSSVFNILALTSLLVFVFHWLYKAQPFVWSGLQMLTQSISSLIGKMANQQINLSVTSSGLPITIAFIITGICSAWLSTDPRKRRLFIYITMLIILNLVYIIVLHPLTILSQTLLGDIMVHPMNFIFVLLILDGIPLFWFLRKLSFKSVSYKLIPERDIAFFLSILFLILSAFILYFPLVIKSAPSPGKVLLYDRGYLNWDKPVFGKYGLTSGGMFGMLPEYLNTMGYKTSIDSSLNEDNLKNTAVIVVINLDKFISQDEKKRVEDFVKSGGSLLVLGDHTGLGGIMEPLNDLLSFVKIRFNFDCAHYLKEDWRDDFEFADHPIFNGVKDEIDAGISVGASLYSSPFTSKPILYAKYGFSDNGNRFNFQNAFLGDRKYNPGELLGDIVLVSEANYGKGKVLVFGDTSPFQNGTLVYTFNFMQNIFQYLSSPDIVWNNSLPMKTIVLLMVLGAIIAFFISKPQINSANILWITVTILIINILFSISKRQKKPVINATNPIAYIDASHLNQFSQYRDDGIWALTYHLMRNKYLPIVQREFSYETLCKSSVAFFISPESSISSNDIEEIDRYVRDGGVAVWSFGYEEKEPMTNIMEKYGIDENNIPLGPVPDSATSAHIHFSKAWPIQVEQKENTDTVCTGWDYPVVISKRIGRGRNVFVADPYFFLSENLEFNHRYKTSNDFFLKIISPCVENKKVSAAQSPCIPLYSKVNWKQK